MTTYILILILQNGNFNALTSINQEFSTRESCISAATSLRKEITFTGSGQIRALQCLKK